MTRKDEQERSRRADEILVPRWVVIVTYVICWGCGGYLLITEAAGEGRLAVLAAGLWLLTLPLAATGNNPLDAILNLLFPARRER